jgi:hypothetical protein
MIAVFLLSDVLILMLIVMIMMLVLKILVMMSKDVYMNLSLVLLDHVNLADVIPLVDVFTGIWFVMIMIHVQKILV